MSHLGHFNYTICVINMLLLSMYSVLYSVFKVHISKITLYAFFNLIGQGSHPSPTVIASQRFSDSLPCLRARCPDAGWTDNTDNGSDDRSLRLSAPRFSRRPYRRTFHYMGVFYSNSSRMIFSCFPYSLGIVLLKVKS